MTRFFDAANEAAKRAGVRMLLEPDCLHVTCPDEASGLRASDELAELAKIYGPFPVKVEKTENA